MSGERVRFRVRLEWALDGDLEVLFIEVDVGAEVKFSIQSAVSIHNVELQALGCDSGVDLECAYV